MMTTAKLFSLVIISLLIGEIENQMVADLESPMFKPMIQPMVQWMFQHPYLVAIPSHGNNNR